MKNYYSTIDEVVLTFSEVQEDENGFASIMARFERPNESGFDFSEWKLPILYNSKAYGFSEDELLQQKRYLRNNGPLIWDIAREG